MSDVETHTIETSTHGRFLLQAADPARPHPLLVGFHGYGESAERHLDDLRRIPGIARWSVASVQGLHRFYRGRSEDIVASWMTRQDRDLAIRDNIEYVDRVVADIQQTHVVSTVAYAGFSQGAAMAFRAAARGAVRCRAIIALGGDIPPEVRNAEFGMRSAERHARTDTPRLKVLLARGQEDGWYTEEKLQTDADFLRSIGAAVSVRVFPGGHEWTAEFREEAGAFLDELLAGQS